jgi:hypothetical protein
MLRFACTILGEVPFRRRLTTSSTLLILKERLKSAWQSGLRRKNRFHACSLKRILRSTGLTSTRSTRSLIC